MHRDLLLAGLCLADEVGVSVACEDAIIEQIVYIYLTSPYNSIRTSFSIALNAWRGTSLARKVTTLVLNLLNQLKKPPKDNSSLTLISSGFQPKGRGGRM